MTTCICKFRKSSYPSDIDPYTRIPNPDCEAHTEDTTMIETETRYPGARLMTTNDHREIEGEGELTPIQQEAKTAELLARAERMLDLGKQIQSVSEQIKDHYVSIGFLDVRLRDLREEFWQEAKK